MLTMRWASLLGAAVAYIGCGDPRGASNPPEGGGGAGGEAARELEIAQFRSTATCEDWAAIKCERKETCLEPWAFLLAFGTRAHCELVASDYCSEWLDHPAEPRPLEVFIACEEGHRELSCDTPTPYVCPDIGAVGPRPNGAPCAHPAECAERCGRPAHWTGERTCGFCYAAPLPYEEPTCATAEDCPEGWLCLDDQTCGPRRKGLPCEENDWCEPGTRCIDGLCADPLALGEDCLGNERGCEGGTLCLDDGVCAPYPIRADGEPCSTAPCAGHLYCAGAYKTCRPWDEEGERCIFFEPGHFNGTCQYEGTRDCQSCGPGLDCIDGVCVDPGPLVCPWP